MRESGCWRSAVHPSRPCGSSLCRPGSPLSCGTSRGDGAAVLAAGACVGEADRTSAGVLRFGLLRRLILDGSHAGSSRVWTPCGTGVRSPPAPDLGRRRERRKPAPAPTPLEELSRLFEDESPRSEEHT